MRKFHFTKESRDQLLGRKEKQDVPVQAQAPEKSRLVEARTDVGKVRAINQDALIVADNLYGVADGMGGHKGGETASTSARDGLIELLKEEEPSVEAFRKAIEEVNVRVFVQQALDEKLSGMGTTLSAIWISGKYVYIGHVGDSRVYLMRSGRIRQMTQDHSLVEELVRAGMLTEEEAENHPMRNVITRAIGTEDKIDADMGVEERKAGDLWLICSDGLHGLVSDEKMEQLLSSLPLAKAADALVQAALDAGGHDNVSAVLVYDGEGAQ